MNEIKIFSPATVANVACGFDVLGFCLDTVGDEMIVRKTSEKGIKITKIEGYNLPLEANKNVAGVAAQALIDDANPDCGFEIEIYKNIKPGSGIGSSSASASGAVFAINELLGNPYNKTKLTKFAMKGEALASGNEHADNIAPGIFGGFTLVKSVRPMQILEIPVPTELYAAVIHPQVEVKTAAARALLPNNVPLLDAIIQWANVGSLVHALHTSDYDLIKDSLQDIIIEPYRNRLIPHFKKAKASAIEAGALGAGISGSGPSIFSLCKGQESANKVAEALANTYKTTNIHANVYVSKINTKGVKVVNN